MKPILSLIIVNWNTPQLTINCLQSINHDRPLSQIPYEIILVDNGSTDDSVSQFRTYQKKHHLNQLKIIANPKNVGFGKANNLAFSLATGNYFLLLNSDTIILHGAISQTLDWLSSHPKCYGCTAQLLNSDKTIQPSGGHFPSLLNMFTLLFHLDDLPLINHIIPPYHPHSPDFYTHDTFYLHNHPQDWVTGAFMLLRREMVLAVGGFNHQIFMYGEEMEMCYRIHLQYPQLQLWYLVGPQVIHLGGASTANKQTIIDLEYKGLETFFKIHRPKYQQTLLKYFILANRQIQLILRSLYHRDQK